jgi:hypothetical protein
MAPRIKTSVLRSQLSKAGYLTGTALAGLGLSFGRRNDTADAVTPDEDLTTGSIEETPEGAAKSANLGSGSSQAALQGASADTSIFTEEADQTQSGGLGRNVLHGEVPLLG